MTYLLAAAFTLPRSPFGFFGPGLSHHVPFVTLFAAVAAAVVIGGVGPVVARC